MLLRRALSTAAAATAAPPPPPASLVAKPVIGPPMTVEAAKRVVTKDTLSRHSDLTNQAPVNGTPKELLGRTVHVQRDWANTMQSLGQDNERKMWNLRFLNENDKTTWTNQLMGWTSTGDPLGRTGLRKIKFPSWESAAAFAKKQGFTAVVVDSPKDKAYPTNRSYQSNFLNDHIVAKLKTTHPRRMMKTLYAHPSGKQSAWVNLGALATQMGTSTHHTDKPLSKLVSQDYWAEKSFDADKPAHRYDNWELYHEWEQKREK